MLRYDLLFKKYSYLINRNIDTKNRIVVPIKCGVTKTFYSRFSIFMTQKLMEDKYIDVFEY